MDIIVQKFGGSSVATTEKLFNVCNHIIKEIKLNKKVIVIVSAQGKTTDKLILEEKEITDSPSKREHDVLVSVGEQITISKLSMCLQKLGYNAVSLTGWQVPIITNSNYTDAEILDIPTERIFKELTNNNIIIIAGFQGIDKNNNITTFGRGGSDTTAVAIAAYINAERCDIYTDVNGIYTSDPNINPLAKKIDFINYDDMLKMANNGAKVLHNKSIEIGKKYNIPIYVKSSFEENSKGSLVN